MQRSESPSPAEVRQALDHVLQSESFANSPKLKDFLSYVVEQTLAGHASRVKGKAIAVDVYQRKLDAAGNAQNLVRVEARRLRRALDEYYAEAGKSARLQIRMEAGSYRPRFEAASVEVPEETVPKPEPERRRTPHARRPTAVIAGLLAMVLGAVALGAVLQDTLNGGADAALEDDTARLAALRERSFASVQAANLADQARGMFFPLFDLKRQEIALASFRHAIDLDPHLPGGYAGAAQVLALLAYLSDDADSMSDLRSEAHVMAEKGVERGPTDGWAQAAMGWTLAIGGDTEDALRRARIAVDLSPEDGHVLDLVGITALVANDPSLSAEVSKPDRPRSGSGRFGANNIWGASQLMLENYPATIKAFSKASEPGVPVSAPSLMLRATAYRASGDEAAARQAIDEMHKTWPGFPARRVAIRFFARDPVTRSRVLETLVAYESSP